MLPAIGRAVFLGGGLFGNALGGAIKGIGSAVGGIAQGAGSAVGGIAQGLSLIPIGRCRRIERFKTPIGPVK